MTPTAAISLSLALIDGLEQLWPVIEDMIKRGEITPDQQNILREKRVSLRNITGERFLGHEWEQGK